MSEQERRQVRRKREETEVEQDDVEAGDRGEKLKEDIDDLLDEIDNVLEENAEEFVRNYIQKGGE